jgi:hypothetical protein
VRRRCPVARRRGAEAAVREAGEELAFATMNAAIRDARKMLDSRVR